MLPFIKEIGEGVAGRGIAVDKIKGCAGQILVVDDEKNYRIILTSLLVRAGYRVWSAAGPSPALDILRSRAIDLVISDLCLGNLDGIELCRKIQAEFGSLPLILFSARPSSRTSERDLNNL